VAVIAETGLFHIYGSSIQAAVMTEFSMFDSLRIQFNRDLTYSSASVKISLNQGWKLYLEDFVQ
jgi:hypothetical protein